MGMENKSYEIFFIIPSKNGPYVVKLPTWAESNSDSLYILVYCFFCKLNFRHNFFAKVGQNFQLNVLQKKWRQNLNRLKSYDASK